MFEVVIFTGIPASGKTSFYKEKFFPSHMYISLDQVRTRSAENELFAFCLKRNKNCVIDNTNITKAERNRYIPASKAHGAHLISYFFPPEPEKCITRNATRTGRARVPDSAILGKFKKLEKPSRDEGFDEIWQVTLSENGFSAEAFNETK